MDAFSRLGLERRLAISAEELREAFRQAGKRAHPDAGGGAVAGDFEAVQQAYVLLGSPSKRLRLWLELSGLEHQERGELGAELMTFFGRVGAALQEVDGVIRRREEARSALAKAMLEGESQRQRERLEEEQAALDAAVTARLERFPDLEAEAEPAVAAGEASRILRELAFLEKWQAQLRERYARLW